MSADSNAQPYDVSGLVAALAIATDWLVSARVKRWSISANRLRQPSEQR
jgi:hypothetical protein